MQYDDAGKIVFTDQEIDAMHEKLVSKIEMSLDVLMDLVKPTAPKHTVNALVNATAIEIAELKEEHEYGN